MLFLGDAAGFLFEHRQSKKLKLKFKTKKDPHSFRRQAPKFQEYSSKTLIWIFEGTNTFFINKDFENINQIQFFLNYKSNFFSINCNISNILGNICITQGNILKTQVSGGGFFCAWGTKWCNKKKKPEVLSGSGVLKVLVIMIVAKANYFRTYISFCYCFQLENSRFKTLPSVWKEFVRTR